MFVLEELDKILLNLAPSTTKKRDKNRLRISLPDVKRIELNDGNLIRLMPYPIDMTSGSTNRPIKAFEKLMESNQSHISTDSLFVALLSPVILSSSDHIPERHYPCAKLLICDRYSYNLFMKLKRITGIRASDNNSSGGMKNFIHKHPNNITAIFLLRDLIDMIDREQEPILVQKRDPKSGKQMLHYNYSLVRRVFPYLRISDLIIMLREPGNLNLTSFDAKGSRGHKILQYFSHFARTSRLIGLNVLNESVGTPHLIYDNVLISQPVQDTTKYERTFESMSLKLPLVHLASMAKQLRQVVDKLSLRVSLISYRKNDPNSQTRFFAQLISTSLAKQAADLKDCRSARLLILDRFYDLQEAFFHADRYGSFLEQERQVASMENKADFKLRIGTIDELDQKLQSEKLTDVLGVILKHTVNLKPKELNTVGTKDGVVLIAPQKSLANTLTTSQSIKRHLDMVKVVYKCLNEGYLLILKLESSLEVMIAELKSLTEPMSREQQDQLVERLQRVEAAFRQLIQISGKTIGPSDVIRVACVLIDTINLFFRKHNSSVISTRASATLDKTKRSLLTVGDLRKTLKVKLDRDDEAKGQFELISRQLIAFDQISRENCGLQARESLEQTIEQFQTGNLDQDSYPIIKLFDSITNAETIILAFLGPLTPNELSKIKAIEAELKKTSNALDILVVANDLVDPEDFLMNL